MDKNIDDRYFRLTNFYTAAFLFTNGMELVNIDRGIDKKSIFIFRDSPEREQLLHDFNFSPPDAPEAKVDARSFIMAIKMLKDKMYQINQ